MTPSGPCVGEIAHSESTPWRKRPADEPSLNTPALELLPMAIFCGNCKQLGGTPPEVKPR